MQHCERSEVIRCLVAGPARCRWLTRQLGDWTRESEGWTTLGLGFRETSRKLRVSYRTTHTCFSIKTDVDVEPARDEPALAVVGVPRPAECGEAVPPRLAGFRVGR